MGQSQNEPECKEKVVKHIVKCHECGKSHNIARCPRCKETVWSLVVGLDEQHCQSCDGVLHKQGQLLCDGRKDGAKCGAKISLYSFHHLPPRRWMHLNYGTFLDHHGTLLSVVLLFAILSPLAYWGVHLALHRSEVKSDFQTEVREFLEGEGVESMRTAVDQMYEEGYISGMDLELLEKKFDSNSRGYALNAGWTCKGSALDDLERYMEKATLEMEYFTWWSSTPVHASAFLINELDSSLSYILSIDGRFCGCASWAFSEEEIAAMRSEFETQRQNVRLAVSTLSAYGYEERPGEVERLFPAHLSCNFDW